jgi:hypothetical protein
MGETQILLGAVAIATALAIVSWPAEAAGVLLLFAPIIWAGGAADIQAQGSLAVGPNIAMAVSGPATVLYARFLFRRQSTRALSMLRTASIGYFLTLLPSVLLSPLFLQSLQGYVRLISPVIFMFAYLHASHARGTNTFQFKALTLATISLLGTIVVATYAGEASDFMGGFNRLRAFNLTPQNISWYSVAAAGVLLCGVLLGKHRLLCAIGIAALVVCTYLTGYRTAWIGMAALLGVVLVVAVRSSLARSVGVLIAFVLLVGESGVVIQSLARYADPTEGALSADTLDAISSGRITTDSVALDRYVTGSPAEWLFGIGIFCSKELATGSIVHGDILATLIESGVVGLVGYLSFLVTLAWILFRVRHYLPQQHTARTFLTIGWALFVAFTVMGVSGALYSNVFVGWYYYGFLGFALAQLKVFHTQTLSPKCEMDTRAVSRTARSHA